MANTFLIINTTNILSVNTYLVTTKSRANYNFLVNFNTTFKLTFIFKPLITPELIIIFLKSKSGLILLKTKFLNYFVLAINLPFNKFYTSTKK